MLKMIKSIITPNNSRIAAAVEKAHTKYTRDLNRAAVMQEFSEDTRISMLIFLVCKRLRKSGKCDLSIKELEFWCDKYVVNSFPRVTYYGSVQKLDNVPVNHTGVLGKFITKITDAGLYVGYNWIQSDNCLYWLVDGLHITFKVDDKADDKVDDALDSIATDDQDDNIFD